MLFTVYGTELPICAVRKLFTHSRIVALGCSAISGCASSFTSEHHASRTVTISSAAAAAATTTTTTKLNLAR